MQAADRRWILEQVMGTAELMGHMLQPHAAALLVDDLAGYPRGVIAKALNRVRSERQGRLTPKAITDRIDEVLGRPGANEAWAMAVNALDERKTVVWTVEMLDAWGVVSELAGAGDLVGARMGFIGAYERLVRMSRDERILPQVQISEGWDKDAKANAIAKAIELGYLDPARHRSEMLRVGYDGSAPAPKGTVQIAYKGDQPVKVSGSTVQKGFHPAIAERLAAARSMLEAKPEQARLTREQMKRAEDEELQRRKEETQRRVEQHLRKGGTE